MDKHDWTSVVRLRQFENNDFEKAYFKLRNKEGRVYSDEIVATLPYVNWKGVPGTEWAKRADSCNRLIDYIQQKQQKLTILEIGCGNGWLSNRMAHTNGNLVYASDVCLPELQQGHRVFGRNRNLIFVYADLPHLVELDIQFDLIVFASSIQYFPSLPLVIKNAKLLLKKGGELHILDSPLYHRKDTTTAINRTKAYYNTLGFPEMADFYFHHSIEEIKQAGFETMYSPKRFWTFLKKINNPFYWVCLKV